MRSELQLHPLLNERYSPRSFSERGVTDAELELVLEAARWSPSSMNEQPWRFRYALRGDAAFAALRDTLSGGNQPWAPNAAAIMAISGMKHHARNGSPNATWAFDTGMAVGNLLAQATSMGIYGHILGGFDHAQATSRLGLVETEEELICLLVLGRLGDAGTLSEPYITRERTPRTRKPLSEVAARLNT